MKLSIVIPFYNEERVIDELFQRILKVKEKLIGHFGFQTLDLEVLFINDGSTDQTFEKLKLIIKNEIWVKIINLSKNYGHQIAITAGIDFAEGDAIVIIDADLQDPPEFIIDMYQKHVEGYDVVYAVRKKREGESWFKLITAKVFYLLLKKIAYTDIPSDTGDFRLISKRVKLALSSMKERHRFIRGMTSWVGFKQTGIEYNRQERYAGVTKYPLKKMLIFSLDGITSFSILPLKIVGWLGACLTLFGFFFTIYIFYVKLFTDQTVAGWSSVIVAILAIGGFQLIALGVIGAYIGRIYEESKRRPLYFIDGIFENK